jgi:hypothetical protein
VAGVAAVPPPRRAEQIDPPADPQVETPDARLVEPEAAEPEAAEPEAAEPEAAEPETAEPETAAPGVAEPGAAEPETTEPGVAEPETVEPEAAEPGAAEPELAEPGAAEPKTVEPEAARPEAARPEAAMPEAIGRAAVGARPAAEPEPAAGPVALTRVEPAVQGDAPAAGRRELLDRVRALPMRVLVAVAAGLAVVVLLVAFALTDRDSPPATPDAAAPAPTTSAGDGAPPPAASPDPTVAPSEPAAETAAPEEPPAGDQVVLPRGWHIYEDRTGFSVAVPRAWRVERDGTIVYFREQTGERRVLGIDQTDKPKPDPVQDWTRQEAQRSGTKPNYRRVRIEAVDYFRAAADWEYTYDGRNARLHAVNRGFITADDQAHAILWITPDRTWQANQDDFSLIARSFEPIP